VRVPLGAAGEPVAALAGRAIVAGVRPEDVRPVGADAGAAHRCRLTLDLVEPMGNELFLYASRDGRELVARVPPMPLPAEGDAIDLTFDATRLHFFDPETGERVRDRPETGERVRDR
jgi:multiple sugar transport system ATP-binding protein